MSVCKIDHILEAVLGRFMTLIQRPSFLRLGALRPPDVAITEPSFLDASANLADSKLTQGLTFMFPNSPGMESHTELH